MSTKQPTSQGISALLTDAGFELGVDGGSSSKDIDGYYVTANRPGDSIVLVSHWGDEDECAWMLDRYTAAIRSVGYRVRKSDDGTYLIVTPTPETPEEG